jgi:hypothetical protein
MGKLMDNGDAVMQVLPATTVTTVMPMTTVMPVKW